MRRRWRPGSWWAMIQRNRATQDARAGGVQRGSPVLRGRKRLPEEECGSQEQRMAVWFTLNESWKSKMEIPAGSKKEIPAKLDASEIRFSAGG